MIFDENLSGPVSGGGLVTGKTRYLNSRGLFNNVYISFNKI